MSLGKLLLFCCELSEPEPEPLFESPEDPPILEPDPSTFSVFKAVFISSVMELCEPVAPDPSLDSKLDPLVEFAK